MRAQMFPWHNTALYAAGWTVGPFYSHTRPIQGRFRRGCPQTAARLDRLLAEDELGLVTAGFSCLAPGARTHLHCNEDGYAWRAHLGLCVPAGDVGLLVDGTPHRWEEGRTLVWDPTLPPQAWNNTGAERHILLLDFFRPEHPRAEMVALMQQITRQHQEQKPGSRGFTASSPETSPSGRSP